MPTTVKQHINRLNKLHGKISEDIMRFNIWCASEIDAKGLPYRTKYVSLMEENNVKSSREIIKNIPAEITMNDECHMFLSSVMSLREDINLFIKGTLNKPLISFLDYTHTTSSIIRNWTDTLE